MGMMDVKTPDITWYLPAILRDMIPLIQNC